MAGLDRTKYKNAWQKEHVDRINLTVPKGEKASIQAHATAQGESITAFIQRAIRETIERDCLVNDCKDKLAEPAQKHGTEAEDQQQPPKLTEVPVALGQELSDSGDISVVRPQQPGMRRAGVVLVAKSDSERFK